MDLIEEVYSVIGPDQIFQLLPHGGTDRLQQVRRRPTLKLADLVGRCQSCSVVKCLAQMFKKFQVYMHIKIRPLSPTQHCLQCNLLSSILHIDVRD